MEIPNQFLEKEDLPKFQNSKPEGINIEFRHQILHVLQKFLPNKGMILRRSNGRWKGSPLSFFEEVVEQKKPMEVVDLYWLVVGEKPLWKMMEFVNWDDDSNPILMGKSQIDGNQTTNQLITSRKPTDLIGLNMFKPTIRISLDWIKV